MYLFPVTLPYHGLSKLITHCIKNPGQCKGLCKRKLTEEELTREKEDEVLTRYERVLELEEDELFKKLRDFHEKHGEEKFSAHPIVDVLTSKSHRASYNLQRLFTYVMVILNFSTVFFEFGFFAETLQHPIFKLLEPT